MPVEVKKQNNSVIFDTDEFPKHDITLESLSAFKPAFKSVSFKINNLIYFNLIRIFYMSIGW